MKMDYNIIVNYDGREVDLTVDDNVDLRQAEFVSAGYVPVADSTVQHLMRVVTTPAELQEAIDNLAQRLTASDIVKIEERFDIERILDNVDQIDIWSDTSEFTDAYYEQLFGDIDDDTLNRILPFLNVEGYVNAFIEDDEYLIRSDDGAVLNLAYLA